MKTVVIRGLCLFASCMALGAAGGCGERGSTPLTAPFEPWLVGQAELVEGSGGLISVFHRKRPPRVRFGRDEAGPLEALRVEWRAGDAVRPLEVERSRVIGDVVLLPVVLGDVPFGDGHLRVSTEDGRMAEWSARWAPAPDDIEPWKRLKAMRGNAAQRPEARRVIQALLDDPATRPVDRGRALAARALLDERDQAYVAVIEGDIESARAFERAGHPSMAAARFGRAAHHAMEDRQLGRAAQMVREICTRVEQINARAAPAHVFDALNAGRCLSYRATLERDSGRLRVAEEGFREAERIAERAGFRSALVYRERRAITLRRQGRFDEALVELDAVLAERTSGNGQRNAATNRAWTELDGFRAGALAAEPAAIQRAFAAIRARAGEGERSRERANLLVNEAYAALLGGDVRHAEGLLTELVGEGDAADGFDPAFRRLVTGEVARRRGDFDLARAELAAAQRIARAQTGDPDAAIALQSQHALGRVERAAGDPAAALALWREALAMSRRAAGRTPLQDGLSAFMASQRALVADLADLLLSQGRVVEAFAAVDAARAPTLRSIAAGARLDGLDARATAEWRTRMDGAAAARATAVQLSEALQSAPADQRAALQSRLDLARRDAAARFDAAFAWLDQQAPMRIEEPGEPATMLPADAALLAFSRLGERWHVFYVADGAVAHRVADTGDAVLAAARAAWGEALLARRRIYVIDGGLEGARRMAEWPVADAGGAVWGERVELAWLPYAGWLRGVDPVADKPALVIADPDGSLPRSRAAARAVARANAVEPLVGVAATKTAVLERLSGARWMHFDGHGVLGQGRPWKAHLRMAGGEPLSLVDVLTARPQVGTVVLSGCETGRPQALSHAEALGLAEGFLMAGAARVVAADRLLGVEEAARFVEAFYRHGGAERPAAAMRATIGAMRQAGDDAWRGWRLFGDRPSTERGTGGAAQGGE